ncbi:MAG TPA: ABC transporter permease [Bellilinea sp.]|nr:ABC transporter permease [Bellilinea sp.]
MEGRLTLGKLALFTLVGLILLFLIIPNFIVVPISFGKSPLLRFPPEELSFRWYERYWQLPGWVSATINSFVVGILTAIAATLVGSVTAYGLVRGNILGKRFIEALLVLPIIIPSLVSAIALFSIMSSLKLLGTLPGFVIGHTVIALPFTITIMSNALRGIDPVLEQAARSLGASRITAIRRVTLPVALPAVLSSMLFAFLISFDELLISLFISTPTMSTLPKKLWEAIRFDIEPTLAAVSTLLVAFSLLVLALIGLTLSKMGKHGKSSP